MFFTFVSMTEMARDEQHSGKHSPRQPKVKGSSPVTAATGRKIK